MENKDLNSCCSQKLQAAISFAAMAHSGQTDKAGEPYFNHPLRVMKNVDTEEAKIVAVLHDVLEDTPYTLRQLREALNLSDNIANALELLTRRPKEDYMEYVRRLSVNPLAVRVKLADLKDNMNLNRLPGISPLDLERQKKYAAALEFLQAESSGS